MLAALAYWGFTVGDGAGAWVLGVGAPLLAAVVWGCGCQLFESPQPACAYSWISSPSRSRRTILAGGAKATDTPGPSGGACSRRGAGGGLWGAEILIHDAATS